MSEENAQPFEFGPLQTKWLEALEGDKYFQGYRMLKTPGGRYCCLGVFCEVAELPWVPISIKNYGFCYGDHTTCGYLPVGFWEVAGFRGPKGEFAEPLLSNEGKRYYSLAECNDTGLLGFKEIAKIIRENPRNVFAKAA